MVTGRSPMPVCVRTCLATWKAFWKSRLRGVVTAPAVPGQEVGVLHLAEDLRLAQDHGVEARGHPEEVLDGVLALLDVEEVAPVPRELAGRP